jgi:hypothetical protein
MQKGEDCLKEPEERRNETGQDDELAQKIEHDNRLQRRGWSSPRNFSGDTKICRDLN